MLSKARQWLSASLLGIRDSPHRIALGVALGFFVGATPTLGVQMGLYLLLATALGANRVSGLVPVWLSNPLTAVPFYYGNWRLGRWLMGSEDRLSENQIQVLLGGSNTSWADLLQADGWSVLWETMVRLGAELWVGSVVVGLLAGLLSYPIVYHAAVVFRRRLPQKAEQRSSGPGPSEPEATAA